MREEDAPWCGTRVLQGVSRPLMRASSSLLTSGASAALLHDESRSSPAEGRPQGVGLTVTCGSSRKGRTMLQEPRQGLLDARRRQPASNSAPVHRPMSPDLPTACCQQQAGAGNRSFISAADPALEDTQPRSYGATFGGTLFTRVDLDELVDRLSEDLGRTFWRALARWAVRRAWPSRTPDPRHCGDAYSCRTTSRCIARIPRS